MAKKQQQQPSIADLLANASADTQVTISLAEIRQLIREQVTEALSSRPAHRAVTVEEVVNALATPNNRGAFVKLDTSRPVYFAQRDGRASWLIAGFATSVTPKRKEADETVQQEGFTVRYYVHRKNHGVPAFLTAKEAKDLAAWIAENI